MSSTAHTAGRERYEVVDIGTGDRFGNHTHAEAIARARIMERNWLYKKRFVVEPAIAAATGGAA